MIDDGTMSLRELLGTGLANATSAGVDLTHVEPYRILESDQTIVPFDRGLFDR